MEGYEFEVLNNLNFNKYKINIICIEILSHNVKSKKIGDKILKIFKKNNFKLIHKTGAKLFFKNTKWNYQ